MIRKASLLAFFVLVWTFALVSFPAIATTQSAPPNCTNGDCPPPPPDCTNGDCPPPTTDCCCVGSNLPGEIRICCCRSSDLQTVDCRESLVLDTDEPEFHQTLAQETLDGFRPEYCDVLLARYCDPPVEEVCVRRRGRRICEMVVKRVCIRLEEVCQYLYCGSEWFPYSEPAPDKEGCEWWDQILDCTP